MENNEILTNEEVMETTEEIVNASSGKGFKVAAGIGLAVLAPIRHVIDSAPVTAAGT